MTFCYGSSSPCLDGICYKEPLAVLLFNFCLNGNSCSGKRRNLHMTTPCTPHLSSQEVWSQARTHTLEG